MCRECSRRGKHREVKKVRKKKHHKKHGLKEVTKKKRIVVSNKVVRLVRNKGGKRKGWKDTTEPPDDRNRTPREIIIDAHNVGTNFSHNPTSFDLAGVLIAITHFESRGHIVRTFLPDEYRQIIINLLDGKAFELEKSGAFVFVKDNVRDSKNSTERAMLEHAQRTNGIVLSNRTFRKWQEKCKQIITKSILGYTFVGNDLLIPDDPLGKEGPSLYKFLTQ